MNKFFKVLGIIFLVALIAVATLIGYGAYKGSKLDVSSKTYVDEIVPVIVSSWSSEDLMKYASPQLRQIVIEEQLKQLLLKLSKLGHLKKFDGSKGDSNVSLTTQYGKVVSATYVAKAKFENGDAEINVRVIQNNGQWQLLNFYVNSPIFLQ